LILRNINHTKNLKQTKCTFYIFFLHTVYNHNKQSINQMAKGCTMKGGRRHMGGKSRKAGRKCRKAGRRTRRRGGFDAVNPFR